MVLVRILAMLVAAMVMLLSEPVAVAFDADGPANPDFEQGQPGQSPPGWIATVPGYAAEITDMNPSQGTQCLQFTRADPGAGMTGVVLQAFDATSLRDRRARFDARIRYEGPGRVQFWVRIDREGGRIGLFDNMSDRPITARDWRTYSILGNIDDDAAQVTLGLILIGGGTAWLDDVCVTDLGHAIEADEPGRPLTDRGLHNLVAFARLYGLVRYFHPSDEAAAADWDAFLLRAIPFIEGAADDATLLHRLRQVFQPVAPSVRLGAGPPPERGDPAVLLPEEVKPDDAVAWLHLGVGFEDSPARQIYSSRRYRTSWVGEQDQIDLPTPGTFAIHELGDDLWCSVPIVLFLQNEQTAAAPVDEAEPLPPANRPEGWSPSGNDRTTRLAAVILAWNVFQHFYPYFDVIDTDWPGALLEALKAAATDDDDAAFHVTLEHLVARLHDGHGRVISTSSHARAPMAMTLVVLETGETIVADSAYPPGEGPQRGDMILAFNHRPIDDIVAEHARRISAATDGFRRWRLGESLRHQPPGMVTIEVRRPDGTRHTWRITHPSPHAPRAGELRHEPRPAGMIAELQPGIWYIDINRVSDQAFTDALPQLEAAEGIIFDLRGYPSHVSTVILSHLIDEPARSAQWHVPVVTQPDGEGVRWKESSWPVMPRTPRLTDNVVFLTDGRAISYAETYLGIVEHYGLGEIVGTSTAGTNGNINPFSLPGGYRIIWTGMRVLKHDGSVHHGIGIAPTIPATRTVQGIAEGRDEVLERAVEVVSAARAE